MKTKDVFFPCGKLKLEGSCYYPDGKGKFPAVVLCHPHPLYGGSMDNNVILAVASALAKKSIIALMFNFRGVGRSQGSFGGGEDEQQDLKAAIDWLAAQPEVDSGKIGVAGYSFGAFVALPQARQDPRVRALALISPALMDDTKMAQLSDYRVPKFIISGSADEHVAEKQLKLMEQKAADPKRLEIIPGADHFWVGHEAMLAERVMTFFSVLFT